MKPSKALKNVTIYTDGACLNNPGPGGYGVVLIHGGRRKEISGGYRFTTNNRMELMAAIAGLRALKTRCDVTLRSDSAYLVNSMIERLPERWKANGWRDGRKQPIRNRDLWQRLVAASARHRVRFVRVRGHAGDAENERCDRLAVEAAKGSDLAVDWDHEP
jgi:ribonuclease HI